MGRSPLTLAALATTADDDLVVTAARAHSGGGDGEFDSAVLTAADGRTLIFRVPMTRSAETKAAEELPALSALSAGIRSRLPFDVPVPAGHAAVGPTIGRLYRFVPGEPLSLRGLKANGALCSSVGAAIAAIHNLPLSVIDDFGLARDTASSVAAASALVVDRATATGRLPEAVARRWDEALAADELWDFGPSVIHGDLSEASFAVDGHEVSGVFGWSKFRIGDPAADLAWFIDLPGVSFDVSEAYLSRREPREEDTIRQRALFHREVDLARWLLHGVDTGDASIVDDGGRMLRALAADIERGAAAPLVPRRPADLFEDGSDDGTEAMGDPVPVTPRAPASAAGPGPAAEAGAPSETLDDPAPSDGPARVEDSAQAIDGAPSGETDLTEPLRDLSLTALPEHRALEAEGGSTGSEQDEAEGPTVDRAVDGADPAERPGQADLEPPTEPIDLPGRE